MSDPKTDKKIESINALKNANKHLADIFADLSKKDSVLRECSADLTRVANQCGDLNVEIWIGTNRQQGSLKKFLMTIANNLEGVRT